MGWRILIDFIRQTMLKHILASMNCFDSDMFKSTNTVVYFDWKTIIYIYAYGISAAKFEQMINHQYVHLRRESHSHASVLVLMRLYPIDKSLVGSQSERRTPC